MMVIPHDIRETALKVTIALLGRTMSSTYSLETISLAIIAERERCAKIVDFYSNHVDDPSLADMAEDIRKGLHPLDPTT